MVSLLEVLGLDEEELEWQQLALCRTMNPDDFHENYENSRGVARMIDQACLSCPVMAECIQQAVDNSEWGVWGGIFFVNGKPDPVKNLHKTPETWKKIRERINGLVL